MNRIPDFVKNELTDLLQEYNDIAFLLTRLFYETKVKAQSITFSDETVYWCTVEDNLYHAIKFILHA